MPQVVGFQHYLDDIWSLVMHEGTGSVGIVGRGGVGKTTLMRMVYHRIRGGSSEYFERVIWVTVSSNLTVQKIQDDISKCIGLFDAKWVEKSFDEKAKIIYNELSGKKFLLLLDDLWHRVDLTELGVPGRLGLIIFTSRFMDVVYQMGAKHKISVEMLPNKLSWLLFRDMVGDDHVLSDPRIYNLAQVLTLRCEGLPMALRTVGKAMASRKTYEEWIHALQEIERIQQMGGMGPNLKHLLEFCFNSLSDDRAKSCFFYFSLFPEDFSILRNDLIDFWICEQILDGIDARDGHNIIATIVEACLLEEENNHVKLLDLIRDYALSVAIRSQMFKNAKFIEATDTETLKTVGWISSMGDSIRNLGNVPHNLFTFLLNHNPFIVIKGGEFSQFMNALTVLDLSNSRVEQVPKGISELVSLQCLNLSYTWIACLPAELNKLSKLQCLNLEHDDQLRVIPKQMIYSMSSLQVLRMFRCGFSVEELEDNIMSVRNMEIDPLLYLKDLKVLSITIICASALYKFFNTPKLSGCTQYLSLEVFWGSKLLDISPLATMENLFILEIHQAQDLEELNIDLHHQKLLRDRSFEKLQEITIERCMSLRELTWVILAPNLTVLRVKSCEEMEEIISIKRLSEILKGDDLDLLTKLEILALEDLPKLKTIYSKALTFGCLKKVGISGCSLLKKLPLNSDNKTAYGMVIEGEEDWWKDIVWEDEATKTTFLPCFEPLIV